MGLACLLTAFGPAVAAVPDVVPGAVYAQPGRLVAVEGARRLDVVCMGQGRPAVVLDAGAGGGAIDWRHVQGQIAEVTQVCAYDRAGHGWSDAAARPGDAANTVDDLHRLVTAAEIPVPFVYVGHSIAGLYGVLYAADYPTEIAGMVLVDPSFAGQGAAVQAVLPAAEVQKRAADRLAVARGCLEMARRGDLAPPKTAAAKACVDTSEYPDKLDDAAAREELRQALSPAVIAGSISEIEEFTSADGKSSADDREVSGVHPDLGNKMLVVLTRGASPPPPGVSVRQDAAMRTAWVAGHDRIARLSRRGSNTLVPDAGHFIQIDRPGVVIDAVRRVVVDVRGK